MPKIRHKLQPRHEIEVTDQEEEALRHQGLLFEGDLAALTADDPVDPADSPAPNVVTLSAGGAAGGQVKTGSTPTTPEKGASA